MTISRDAALARLGRESAEHVQTAAISIEQSREHVRNSKAAIERSLDLLRDTVVRNRDEPFAARPRD